MFSARLGDLSPKPPLATPLVLGLRLAEFSGQLVRELAISISGTVHSCDIHKLIPPHPSLLFLRLAPSPPPFLNSLQRGTSYEHSFN